MKADIEKLLAEKGGIRLDLGCGDHKQKGFVGIDLRDLPGVDIVHDLEQVPYPLPDECAWIIAGSHIVEHINPHGGVFLRFMNELWRVAKVDAQLAFAHPYGINPLFVQDPTHCNPCNEATWQYFDPRYPLYQIYRPKPWKLVKGFPVWQNTGIMEVLFNKVTEEEGRLLYEKDRLFDNEPEEKKDGTGK